VADVASLIADARRALEEYQSKAWHRTVVTTHEDEAVVTEALQPIEGIRIIASSMVQPGQVIVMNDDAQDAALELALSGEVWFAKDPLYYTDPEWVPIRRERIERGSTIINFGPS
jgi:hypothetical protein